MREAAISIRERHGGGGGAGLPAFLTRHRPAWGVAAGATLLLAGVGAFGTGDAQPWTLLSYWAILMFTAAAAMGWATDRFEASPLAPGRAALTATAIVVGTTLVMTPFVYLLAGTMLDGGWALGRLPRLAAEGLLVAGALYAVHRLAAPRTRTEARVGAEPPARRGLRERLPARLQDAAIEALQAEDHYLRVHTDRGSALILMPLSEAIASVEPERGRRTHRSWWVARGSVAASARQGCRALLTLNSGLRVPVSRTFAPALRREGWFQGATR